MIEMAVLGAIILTVLATMINYGQMLNAQHDAKMYAFRHALHDAYARAETEDKYGEVSFTVNKDIYPVSILDPERRRSKAAASYSVIWDRYMGQHGAEPGEENPPEETFGVTYYQLGNTMIGNATDYNDGTKLKAPTMKARRKLNADKSKTGSDYFFDILFAGLRQWISSDEQVAYMPAPVEREVGHNQYNYTETAARQEDSGSLTTGKNTVSDENSQTVYEMQTPEKIMADDKNIIEIVSIPPDINITQTQNVQRNTQWVTPK